MNSSHIYLLTGEPRVGKTSTIKKIIETLGREQCGGFYIQEIRTEGERRGFQLITLDGQTGTLAHVDLDSPILVGRYGVNLDCLNSIGIAAIDKALATKPLIIVDEIGPMQAYSEPFKKAIMDILASPRPLLATIALEPHPWLDELKQQKGVELYTLNPENQKQIIDTLTDRLASLLNKDRF